MIDFDIPPMESEMIEQNNIWQPSQAQAKGLYNPISEQNDKGI